MLRKIILLGCAEFFTEYSWQLCVQKSSGQSGWIHSWAHSFFGESFSTITECLKKTGICVWAYFVLSCVVTASNVILMQSLKKPHLALHTQCLLIRLRPIGKNTDNEKIIYNWALNFFTKILFQKKTAINSNTTNLQRICCVCKAHLVAPITIDGHTKKNKKDRNAKDMPRIKYNFLALVY